MAKGVFLHRAGSIYDDEPGVRYHFPSRYKSTADKFLGDWIVYNELQDGKGSSGYSSIAHVGRIEPDSNIEGHYFAYFTPKTYLGFEKFVPYRDGSTFRESRLITGTNKPSGYVQSAVREISDTDFFHICALGNPLTEELPRFDEDDVGLSLRSRGFQDEETPFTFDEERERFQQIISRPIRKKIFRTSVINAYEKRCAFTGLQFINGRGRAEVQAAHIKPVEHDGPDHIQNGIALSGTIHWMFDRGLVSLSDDFDILVSRQVNDSDRVWSMMTPNRKACVPQHVRNRPHPRFLKWHRENCFKH